MSKYKYWCNGSMSGNVTKGETYLLGGQVYSELVELEAQLEVKQDLILDKDKRIAHLEERSADLDAQVADKDKVIEVLAKEIKKHVHPVTVGGDYHNDNEPWTWWKQWAESKVR